MAQKPGLDKGTVVATAAALADERGLDGVTLAAVAEALGVRTPSLYNHVDGLPGLRRELSLYGLRELQWRLMQAALGKAEDVALSAMLDAYRQFALERPGVYACTLRAPSPGDAEVERAADAVLGTVSTVLAPYGLVGDHLVHVLRSFRAIGHGFVSLETAGSFEMGVSTDESFRRLVNLFLTGVRAVSMV